MSKAKLLFVDDEPRIVNLLRVIFRADYEVFTATGGAEALQIIHRENIQVIVSDQRMPEMLGIELLSKVREVSPNTMRILLTGYSDLAAIVGSVNDGEVFRFINKPWSQDEIKATIADAVAISIETAGSLGYAPSHAIPAPLPDKPIVLVVDSSETERHWTSNELAADFHVIGVSSINDAIGILAQRDVAVIVTEIIVAGQSTAPLLNVLKQQYPLVTSVVLTSTEDSDLVVKLINQAQVSRFLRKPMQPFTLRRAVAAALLQHLRFREDPRLMNRHRVQASTDAESVSLVATFGKMFGALKQRLKFFGSK